MNPIPATVLLLTKNEEVAIGEALASVADFARVIVIDSNSTDKTVEIAKNMGALVKNFTWNGGYPKKKEWALQNVDIATDWVLYLDADERVKPDLSDEIRQALESSSSIIGAYEVPLDYYFLGKQLKHGHQVRKRALCRASATTWPHPDDLHVSTMWEVEGHYQPDIVGEVRHLTSSILHDDPDPLYDYFARHNRYSDWEAGMAAKGITLSKRRGAFVVKHVRPLAPLVFFFYSYCVKRGFRDGPSGFHYAVAQSFYYWQINVKLRERRSARTK